LGGFTAAVIAAGLLVSVFPETPVDASPVADEAAFVAKLNAVRTAHRLPPLSVDPRLTVLARSWAAKMAAQGDIFHNMNLPKDAPSEWLRVGENVGVAYLADDEAGAVEAIHAAFVSSPTHYANLVGRYTKVGVGVVFANGQVFAAEEFMAVQPPAPKAAKAKAATVRPSRSPRRGGWYRNHV
jgi:uncharacterized protein YkwD